MRGKKKTRSEINKIMWERWHSVEKETQEKGEKSKENAWKQYE